MSAVTIDNDLVHYEVLGRGRPVILLHGWLSSWRYWIPTMQQLSMKYRTYALDLWGYGDSGKDPERLSCEAHTRLLGDFMDQLGIVKAALIGHSLGGAVVIRYALRSPDRVARLMTISAPLFEYGERPQPAEEPPVNSPAAPSAAAPVTTAASGPGAPTRARPPASREESLAQHSKPTVARRSPEMEARLQGEGGQHPLPDIAITPGEPSPPSTDLMPQPAQPEGQSAGKDIGHANPLRDRLLGVEPRELLERQVGRDSPHYRELIGEVTKTAPTAFAASVLSFDQVDLAHDVRRLTKPTLLIHGEKDAFMPPPSQGLIDYLGYGKGDFRCVIWPEVTHFPMLDDPTAFHRLVMDFLETHDLDDLEFKERWRRMVR